MQYNAAVIPTAIVRGIGQLRESEDLELVDLDRHASRSGQPVADLRRVAHQGHIHEPEQSAEDIAAAAAPSCLQETARVFPWYFAGAHFGLIRS